MHVLLVITHVYLLIWHCLLIVLLFLDLNIMLGNARGNKVNQLLKWYVCTVFLVYCCLHLKQHIRIVIKKRIRTFWGSKLIHNCLESNNDATKEHFSHAYPEEDINHGSEISYPLNHSDTELYHSCCLIFCLMPLFLSSHLENKFLGRWDLVRKLNWRKKINVSLKVYGASWHP